MRQIFDGRNCFFDLDLLILLLFGLRWQALPWQTSADEVHEHHTDLLQVIPARLLNAHVGVQAGVPRRSGQLLIVFVADVAARARVLVALGQAEVDDVDDVLLLADADQEVVRLYVAVQESALMDELYALQHLNRQHQDCLQSELASAVFIQVFETGPQQVHHEDIVISDLAKVVHLWHAHGPVKDPVQLRLVVKLRELRLCRLKLDRNILARLFVLC